MGDRVLYGLIECPFTWESVWGIARCMGSWNVPSRGSQCGGSRAVWAHRVSHHVGVSVGDRVVYGLIVSHHVGVSVGDRAVYGLIECPFTWESVWGIARCMGSWNVPSRGSQCGGSRAVWAHRVSLHVGVSVGDRAVYGLMECPITWESVWGIARCMGS